jgi:hypothetical protein
MQTGRDDVRFQGKTGSELHAVKATRMTLAV